MRILHVVLTPRHSGAEVLAAALAQAHAASRFGATGVLGVNPCEERFEPVWADLKEQGVWCEAPARKLGRLGRVRYILSALRAFQPDVVVAHSVIPAAYARLATRLTAAVPVVTVLHAATNDDYAGTLLRWSERVLGPLAAAVVTVTETAASNYRVRCGQPRRLMTIPNGTDLDRYAFDAKARSRLRSELGVSDNTQVVLQVGRLTPVKNQAASVLALKEAVRAGRPMELWLAGLTEDAAYEAQVRQLVADHELQGRVLFLGSRTDVASLLSAADVYVMPSEREAHSVAMIEALASGVPIVASAIPVFEFARRFEGFSMIDPDNHAAFAQAIDRASATGYARYERDLFSYSMTHVANRYAALFREVTSPTLIDAHARERVM